MLILWLSSTCVVVAGSGCVCRHMAALGIFLQGAASMCGPRRRTAVQRHLAGTGVGSFNDRVRDAAIGGSPFTDPRQQGLMTGLYLRPWPEDSARRLAWIAPTWACDGLVQAHIECFDFDLSYFLNSSQGGRRVWRRNAPEMGR